MAAAPSERLEEYQREVLRYEQDSPDDPQAALVACSIARRQGSAFTAERCERARALARTDQQRAVPEKLLRAEVH